MPAARSGTVARSDFRPAWWLRGPHRQTVWASALRRPPRPPLRRQRLDTPDGDFVDVDWLDAAADHVERPLVLILHGLEGSSRSAYASGLLAAIGRRGWRGAVLHFRGCSGEPNRLRSSYNAGFTDDLDWFVRRQRERRPATPLVCVGYSLGGNALLRWLGEKGADAPLDAAVAVSVPFLLETGARRMRRGLSRLYQRHLLSSMRDNHWRKFSARDDAPLTREQVYRLRDFLSFDDAITAPLHGYADANDYYRRVSGRYHLRGVRRPTLILHAADDPFMLPEAIPDATELAPAVRLELSARGGHVGFVDGALPWRAGYWLERRIPKFLERHLRG